MASLFSLLLLLTTAIFATASSNSEHASTLQALHESKGQNVEAASSRKAMLKEMGQREEVNLSRKDEADEETDENDEDQGDAEDEDAEDEYDAEDNDEYEDELKAVAESHEAMSKDEPKDGKVSVTPQAESNRLSEKNYDSHEKTIEETSDENMTSNEALGDYEIDDDEEVSQLKQYKKQKIRDGRKSENLGKKKRMPTVKKELSTQKEILISRNETQVPKGLFPSEETLNRINEESGDIVQRRNLGKSKLANTEMNREKIYPENFIQSQISPVDRYVDQVIVPEYSKKMDKRQERVLNDLKSLLLATYEKEQQRTLAELGAQERAMATNLLKLLSKLADDPAQLERVQQFLADGGNRETQRNTLNTQKRLNEISFPARTSLATPYATSEAPKKTRKKKKKKKKKKKLQQSEIHSTTDPSTTTTTTVSSTNEAATTSPSTSTEKGQQKSPVHWRLVAERLFGPTWPQRSKDENDNSDIAKVHYSAPAKSRLFPSAVHQLVGENKHFHDFDKDRPAIMVDAPQELDPQSRQRLHFGKINTHQNSDSSGPNDLPTSFQREPARLREYEQEEPYPQQVLFQDFPRARNENNFALAESNFAMNREYRPHGRDYATSQNWRDTPFKYERPWKSNYGALSSSKWRLFPEATKIWPGNNNRDYWNGEAGGASLEKPWLMSRSPQYTWNHEQSAPWSVQEKIKFSPPLSTDSRGDEDLKKYHLERPNGSWEKSRSLADINRTVKQDENNKALPKITMTTWNSLTSDPATWPYKLPGAKPWPKDQSGKSYNPNADLVRKLGLDKQGRVATSLNESMKEEESNEMDGGKYNLEAEKSSLGSKYPNKYHEKSSDDLKESMAWNTMVPKASNVGDVFSSINRNGESPPVKNWSTKEAVQNSLPKIKSMDAWIIPGDQSTWRPYEVNKPVDSLNKNILNDRWSPDNKVSSFTYSWPPLKANDNNSWNPKGYDTWKGDATPNFAPSQTWQPKWKSFIYHKIPTAPANKSKTSADSLSSNPKNAIVAISAGTPAQYSEGDWRRNIIEEIPSSVAKTENILVDDNNNNVENQLDKKPLYYEWITKKSSSKVQQQLKAKISDPLEDQLETLRERDSLSSKDSANYTKIQPTALTGDHLSQTSIKSSNTKFLQKENSAKGMGESVVKEGKDLIKRNEFVP
ncbi:microtubule-associated protein futsch-like [Prorops nasuta]|uniref:microtubule-associated protein futsch-like n=1 Tax=Prorops nasuta TaxID=863751 RepID=UPI0034CF8863